MGLLPRNRHTAVIVLALLVVFGIMLHFHLNHPGAPRVSARHRWSNVQPHRPLAALDSLAQLGDQEDDSVQKPEKSSTSSQPTDHARASSQLEELTKDNSQHEKLAKARSQLEDHAKASSQLEDHAQASSQLEDHAKASSRRADHAQASSQLEDHAHASSQLEDHAKASSQLEDHAQASSQLEDHAKASSRRADHAQASSRRADHAKASSQLEDHAKASSQLEDHAQASSQRADEAKTYKEKSGEDRRYQQPWTGSKTGTQMSEQAQTSDNWPLFSNKFYPGPIPRSPYFPNYTITWDFNTTEFLQRPGVKGQAPKLITWMVPTRWTPSLPEPVRLRVCPEMPCRLTTNKAYQNASSALLWAGQIMREKEPPVRSHPDQVYVFHNHEPQLKSWIGRPSFRKPGWKSAFNWTMTYRADSDIQALYGYMAKRKTPARKNYTDIVSQKTKLAAMLTSNCHTMGRREDYVKRVKTVAPVHVYGGCFNLSCPRSSDDACFKMFSKDYKFFFSFENSFCTDYISEKFFRYIEADVVIVARGSNQYKNHVASGTFINTADFATPEALARHLLYLDSHPEEYVKILQAKDRYQALYEDWPIRTAKGKVRFMAYHYQAVSFCDMCRRLWDLESFRHTVLDIAGWFDKENCYPPTDLG